MPKRQQQIFDFHGISPQMNKIIQQKLQDGVKDDVFPQAELLVSKSGTVQFHDYAGNLQNPQDAYFDLASLTKPLCTAMLCALFVQENKLDLNDPIKKFFSTHGLERTTIRQLLNHQSGLAGWAPLYSQMIHQQEPKYEENKKTILEIILHDDNLFKTSGKPVYSDLGYILLGRILENIGGDHLDTLFKTHISDKLGISDEIFFVPLAESNKIPVERFIPTETCALRKITMQGQVMDRNCYVQGGISGHAGLFSNALTIHKILDELRSASNGQSTFIKKQTFDLFFLPAPSRQWTDVYFTLGFETPTKGMSQSGTLFSKNSIGHLGYAGTSLWWDLEEDFWIILLTNRCMPNRKNFKIQKYRPELHDLIVKQIIF